MPASPATLAISCGSQMAVVTRGGDAKRSNSNGVTHELSICRCDVVDEAGDEDLAETSMTRCASLAGAGADDGLAADGDVPWADRRSQGPAPCPAQHQIGRFAAGGLIDQRGKGARVGMVTPHGLHAQTGQRPAFNEKDGIIARDRKAKRKRRRLSRSCL